MSDKIQKILISTTTINLYDVVAFHVKDKTLVVFTVGETLYFSEPVDIDDAEAAHAELLEKFTALESSGEPPVENPDEDPDTGGGDTGGGDIPPVDEPGDGGSDPGDGGSDPGDGGTDPGDGGTDPGDGDTGGGDTGGGVEPDPDMNPDFDPTGKNFNEDLLFYYDPVTEIYYDEQGYEIDDGSNGVMNPDFSPAGKTYDPIYGLWTDNATGDLYNVRGYQLVAGEDPE